MMSDDLAPERVAELAEALPCTPRCYPDPRSGIHSPTCAARRRAAVEKQAPLVAGWLADEYQRGAERTRGSE